MDNMDDSSVGITPRLSCKRDMMFPICTVAPKCHGGRGRLSTWVPEHPLNHWTSVCAHAISV